MLLCGSCFVLAASLVTPLVAFALPKSEDIIGIKSGMNIEQVTRAIKQYEPKAGVGVLSNSLQACVKSEGEQCTDKILVEFGKMTGKAYLIKRYVNVHQKMLTENIQASLVEKYGQPVFGKSDSLRMIWAYDAKNAPITNQASLNGCAPESVNGAPNKGLCGRVWTADILGSPGIAAASFTVELTDYMFRYEDGVAESSRDKANEAKQKKSISGNVPKL